jgi:hypothetical protein
MQAILIRQQQMRKLPLTPSASAMSEAVQQQPSNWHAVCEGHC